MKDIKNIVIYARYSSESQRPESIEQQVAECRKYAKDNKFNVVDVYNDKAKTGRNDDRDDFKRMMKDSKKGAFDAVLIWKFDRFARNMREQLNNEYELMQNGVKLPRGHIATILPRWLIFCICFCNSTLAELFAHASLCLSLILINSYL